MLGFGAALVFCVLLLFGVLPALRASAVKPVSALKGGEDDPQSRRRLMHGMIAAQVAFCFLVIFISGLFVRTFESLANKPLGFAPDNLLLLDVVTQQGQPAVVWDQIADSLRSVPGVERVAIAGWPLLSGGNWNNFVANGALYALQYDLRNDFKPIALLSETPLLIVAKKAMPANDLKHRGR